MRIGITGTMSVGKTTLVNALKNELGDEYKFFTERSKYLHSLGIPLNNLSSLNGQLVFLGERAAELMNENMVTDRTVIDVMSFAKTSKVMTKEEKEYFEFIAKELIKQYDVIFYIDPEGIPIEDNGIRDTDEYFRDVIDFTINQYITKYSFSTTIIRIHGSTENRIKTILNYLS